jgi:hypothetical protein
MYKESNAKLQSLFKIQISIFILLLNNVSANTTYKHLN